MVAEVASTVQNPNCLLAQSVTLPYQLDNVGVRDGWICLSIGFPARL